MFDSHCHLHDRRVADPEAQLARARAAGVRGFLLAGVEPDGWLVEEALARAHGDVLCAFGVHPQLAAEKDDAACDRMVAALGEAIGRTRPAAIGEIGLDAVGARKATLERQERVFRAQLAIARDADLPVVLHVLRAQERALTIVRKDGAPRSGGVVHSYSGSAELVRDWVKLGLSISFAGKVTNPAAERPRRAAAAVPREHLLVETDAPFQSEEPAFLVAIVLALARIRGETEAEVASSTEANARRMFGVEDK
jgi:TatD DNase family protein